MRAIDFIPEARRNPEQNPKVSVNDVIHNELIKIKQDKSGNSTIADVTNLFVSFTKIPKLGINPGSTYHTPNGIYAYPAEYVMKKVGTNNPMNYLPFAGDEPWVNLFTVTDGVINLKTLNKTNYKMYINELEQKFVKSGILPPNEFKDIVDFADTDAKRPDYWGGQLWYVTMEIAEYLSKTRGGKRNNIWNAVWRSMGLVGVVDTGAKIIHESEPTQAVFFDLSKIDVITRIPNKYSPDVMSSRQRLGLKKANKITKNLIQLRTFLQTNPSTEDLYDWMNVTDQYGRWSGERWDLFPRLPKEHKHNLLSIAQHYLRYYPSGKVPREDYLVALTNDPVRTLEINDKSNKLKWNNFVNQQQLAAILENWRIKNPTSDYEIWTLFRSIVQPNGITINKTFKMHPDLAKVLLKINPKIIIEVIGMNNSQEIIDFARQVAEEKNNFYALRFINNIGKQQT